MAYQVTLNGNRQLTIANQAQQTQISLMASNLGQQQNQSSSFTTGTWKKTPRLFKTTQGYVLQLEGEKGKHFVSIESNSIQTVSKIQDRERATEIELETIADPISQTTLDFQPMQPMQPMRLGNMSMDINSMSMQMGNMSLNSTNADQASTPKVFCSQCGTEARQSDRFCRSCGHELNT